MSVFTTHIDDVQAHIICKARAFLNRTVEKRPARQIIQERRRKALADLSFKTLNLSRIPEKAIASAVQSIFYNMDYPELETDRSATAALLSNLSAMLEGNEFTVTSGSRAIDYALDGMVLNSRIDITARCESTGYIHPVVVDFSNTRYEPFYNPIVYHAQSIVDFLDLNGTNTTVKVFGISGGSIWDYDHRKYGPIVHASLREAMHEMKHEFFGVRFGWWCAGCPYRGICHALIKEEK